MCKQPFNRIFSKHYTEHFKQMTYTTILVPQIFFSQYIVYQIVNQHNINLDCNNSQITLFNQELKLFDQDLPIC